MNEKHLERDLLQQELASNKSKLAQLKHQQERLENRIAYYEKGERKKRTHRLCTIAGTLESIAPEIRELTTPEVSELLEYILFPKYNVRFIAINSGVDSANQMDNDFTPFLNIINEFYVKDSSKKGQGIYETERRIR